MPVMSNILKFVLRAITSIIIGLLFFAIGVLVHGVIFGTSTIMSMQQPVFVWLFGGLGAALGYKYAVNIYGIIVDNLWQIF